MYIRRGEYSVDTLQSEVSTESTQWKGREIQ